MKQGIHLGRRPPRAPWLETALLAFVLIGAAFSIFSYVSARRGVWELRGEVARLEGELEDMTRPFSEEEARDVAARLRAVLESGAVQSVPPTSVLRFVAAALPGDVILSSLGIDASPPVRSVTLEAETIGGERISELQRELSAAPGVARTTLLEERRMPDGTLAVRLRLDLLAPEGTSR